MNETMLLTAHGLPERVDDAVASAVLAEVARDHGLTVADIVGRDRHQPYTEARAEAAWRVWKETDLKLGEIGALLDGRDHSSIAYLIARHAMRQKGAI